MRLSKLPHVGRLIVPQAWQALSASDLIQQMELVTFINAGYPFVSPILRQILLRLEECVRSLCVRTEFSEVKVPLVMHKGLVERTGAYERFAQEFIELSGPPAKFVLSATSEETFLAYVEIGGLYSYRQLPVRLFHLKDSFRNINRPEGYYKSRQLYTCILLSLDADYSGFLQTLELFQAICEELFAQIGLSPHRVISTDETTVEYLFKCERGDRPIAKSVATKRDSTNSKGNLELYSSLAMGYPYLQVEQFKVAYTDDRGRRQMPVMGTYGIGLQRCVYALFESCRDRLGIKFAAAVRPFDVVVIPVATDDVEVCRYAEQAYELCKRSGARVALDDRHSASFFQRMTLADFLGIPLRLIIGIPEMNSRTVEHRTRGHHGTIGHIPLEGIERAVPDLLCYPSVG